MKKKYAALLVAAAIMAVPGNWLMGPAEARHKRTVSHGGGDNSSASSKVYRKCLNAGTITKKTTTGVNKSTEWFNGITVSQGTSGSNNAVGFASI